MTTTFPAVTFSQIVLSALLTLTPLSVAQAQVSPFVQSVAIAAADQDEVIAAFYAARNYAPIWTGAQDAERRNAFLSAISHASDQGLAVQRYDARALTDAFR